VVQCDHKIKMDGRKIGVMEDWAEDF
jgi:hypothetical protein